MKTKFFGHFKEDDKSISEVWDECLFVFDANILLNLYRYSDVTRTEFISILEKVKDRVLLPNRAAEEYFANRTTVIDKQSKSYDETIKAVTSLKNSIDNSKQHPFVENKLKVKADKVFVELLDALSISKNVHTKRIYNDEIKQEIASLFDEKVTEAYDNTKLEQIILSGQQRFKDKVPPGYKDLPKLKEGEEVSLTERLRPYGDLIVWFQIMDLANEHQKPVVFVTDDRKEDWWEKFQGKTIGPRSELVVEFRKSTNNKFLMYQADQFLEFAKNKFAEAVSDTSIEEIRDISISIDNERKHKRKFYDAQMEQVKSVGASLQQEFLSLSKKQDDLKFIKSKLEEDLKSLEAYISISKELSPENSYTDLEGQYNSTLEKLKIVSRDYQEANETTNKLSNQLDIMREQYNELFRSAPNLNN